MLLIVLLAALPFAGFARHVLLQLEELRELNLRSLGKASNDIAELLRNAETVVGGLGGLEGPAYEPGYRHDFVCDLDAQQQFLKLKDGLEKCDKKKAQDSNSTCADDTDSDKTSSGKQPPFKIAFCSEDKKYEFEVQLEEMLAVLPASDEIDLLLIVERNQNVVADYSQRSDLSISIKALTSLRNRAGEALKDMDLSATLVEQIVLSDLTFDLLCQPIQIDSGIYSNLDLAICGLVDSSRQRTRALTVTPLIVVVLLAVVIFGVLCWPMMKVVLMSDRERFKFSDLYFVLFGAWGAVMIVVILALGFQTHIDLAAKIEKSNENIANSINTRLFEELAGLHKRLEALDDPELIPTKCEALDTVETARIPTVRSDFEMAFWVYPDRTGQQFRKATTMRRNTPLVKLANREYFKRARDNELWTVDFISEDDQQEEQRWFVENVRSKTTTAVRTLLSAVSQQCVKFQSSEVEDYDTKQESCLLTPNHKVNLDPHYALGKCEDETDLSAVVVVQARLISVSEPVLSPGVGFAVIDDKGRAIFHSDPRRALKDNFFDELSDGMRLRAAVLSRTQHHMGSNYLGRPHQLFVRPMGDLPWSLIVFSDNEPKRTVILEIVGHAILLAFIFLVINLVGTLVYLAWEGQEIPRWFWPTPCSRNFHAKWSFFLVLVFMLFTASLSRFSADIRLLLCLIVPASILILILITSRRAMYARLRGSDQPVGRVKISPRLWYVVASGLLWLNVAVVPAYVFYSNAQTAAVTEFVKQENIIHAENLEARQCSMSAYYSRIPRDCGGKNQCECRRGNACDNDIYRSAIYDPEQKLSGTAPLTIEEPSVLWKWFAEFKPIYSESIGYRRYLFHQDHSPWESNGEDELTYRHPHPVCADEINITSIVPIVNPGVSGIAVVLSGIVFLILGFAWLRYVANKLYFYEIEECGLLGLDDVMERDNQVLAFIASDADRERLSTPDGSDLTIHKIQGPIDGNKCAELQSLVDAHDRLLVLAEYDSRSFNCQAPEGMVVKWFARGEANESPDGGLVGGDHWRRHLNGAIDGDWVNHELATSSDLFSPKRSQLVRTILTGSITKREALLQLSEAMHDYYQTLWLQCSQEEHFVLVQLIEEAVVNPKQASVVRALMRRGIIRRDPALRTMNESFAQWIADTHTPENLEIWEASSDGANWSQLRWVFVSVLILIFAFLWFTQRHVVESGLAFLSVAGIAIPSLLKLASTVRALGGQADS